MKTKKILLAIVLCLFTCGMVWADGDPEGVPSDPTTEPDENAVTSIPLDGGVSLLIAAGVAYGAKKYREHKKQTDNI